MEKTRVIVIIEGGIVQNVFADRDNIELVILDQDVSECWEAENLKDTDGKQFHAYVDHPVVSEDASLINHFFNQFQ